MKKSLLALIVLLTLGSCAVHNGIMTGNVIVQGTDFETVDIAYGESNTAKVFGIGGLSTNTLVLDARNNMYTRYPLKKGQTYANVAVDFRRLFVFPYWRTNCHITADIVQYGKADTNDIQPVFNRFIPAEPELTQFDSMGTLQLGDSVTVFESNSSVVYGVLKEYYEDQNGVRFCRVSFGEWDMSAVPQWQVFGLEDPVVTKSGDELSVGDECTFTRYGKSANIAPGMIGTVVAVRNERAILKFIVNGTVTYAVFDHNYIKKP